MKSKSNIFFFLGGLSLFAYLMLRFGLDRIAANIGRAGWSLLYVIFIWLIIYLLNTIAWKLILGEKGNGIPFLHLFMVTVSGFVLNYITPVVALGGEPYKVKALSNSMETRHSLSAVVLYRMVHLLGHMLLLLSGIVVAIIVFPFSLYMGVLLGITGCVIFGVIMLTLSGHREGIFERLNALFGKISFVSRTLQKYKGSLQEMDSIITEVYRNQRTRFYLSIFAEYLSRACMGLEVYLILNGIGVQTSLATGLFLYVVYSIIINLLFFIPLNLGAREGGLYLGLETLALPPLLGAYLGVVMRIREFFWILLGLMFILITSPKRETTPVELL